MALDLDRYKQRTAKLDTAGIDFAAFRRQPLPDDALRCLRYMHDVEFHTVCYLRDLLVTSAHRDPDITAFLTFWCHEEFWHGEAIAAVLDAHREPAGPARIAPLRKRRRWRDVVDPLGHLVGSALAGDSFIAIHMTWGAVNEWTTQAGYSRLAAQAGHPVLTELLGRIMRQEGRHIDFYSGQARRRLASDERARRLTRLALRRLWRPVGAGLMPEAETAFIVRCLFGDADGRAAAQRIDRHVDRLPGLAGLRLAEGAVDRYAGGSVDSLVSAVSAESVAAEAA